MQKNICIVFIYSINEFHLSKKLCCTNTMFAQHNTKLDHILPLNYMQIRPLSRIIWQFGAFLLGNLAHYNSYSALYCPFNTPANSSISLLEIPKGFPNAPITWPNSFDNILCFHTFQCYPHCFLRNFALLR